VDSSDELFERFYRDHFQRVAAYLLTRSDRALAQDALARTFEIAWRRMDAVPEDALPWLFGVARKVLSDLRRTRGRTDALFERMSSAIAGNEGLPDHAEATLERLNAIEALRSLSILDREALLLVAWDGLTEKRAAQALGCSRGAFALRIHRARGRLRSLMQQQVEHFADAEPSFSPNVSETAVPAQPVLHAIEESR
jgi:RNA polymerase sigma-70 factor (ECF subfamily)